MLNAMTSHTEPYDIKWEAITTVMVSLWLAFLQTFRALSGTHDQPLPNRIEQRLASLSSLWVYRLIFPAVVFTGFSRIQKSPLAGALSDPIGIFLVPQALILLSIFCVLHTLFRIETPIFSLPFEAFIVIPASPFSE